MIVVVVDTWVVATEMLGRFAQCGHVVQATSPGDVSLLRDLPWEDVSAVIVAPELADQAELALEGLSQLGLDDAASVPAFVLTTLPTYTAIHLGRHNGSGFRVIESPVMSGGPTGARSGTLSMSVAGPTRPEDLAFLLATIATTATELTDYGQPSTIKLLSNALMSIHARVLADVIVLADEMGIDARRFRNVLLDAAGASRAAERFASLDAALLEKDARLAESSFPSLAEADTLFAGLLHGVDGLESHLEAARGLLRASALEGD